MDTPTLPAHLTFYTVTHPEGGWCAVEDCTEPYVTFCRGRAQELAEQAGGEVVAHEYHVHAPPAAAGTGLRRMLTLVRGGA